MFPLLSYGQMPYKRKKKYKNKVEIGTKVTAVTGGVVFIMAGTISMKTKGLTPFVDNGTKWKVSPSEWAIIGGFTVMTFGIVYKF